MITGRKNSKPPFMFVADMGATCTMGPTIEGCTDITYVNQSTIVGDGGELQMKARSTFHGILKGKDGSEKKVKIKNYAFIPTLDEWLYSVTYAKKMGMKISDEGSTISLIKGKNKVKFDYVFDKGSSFQMCAHIVPNQEYCESNKEEAMNSKIIMDEEELHEKIGHPSTELTLSTAKNKEIKLK